MDSRPETLSGWKEIGAYLGKSVRAVQRWEHDLGLPVHRIETPTGQVVYAFRAEIASWRASMDTRPGWTDDEPGATSMAVEVTGEAAAAGAAQPVAPPVRGRVSRDRRVLAAIGGIVIAASVWLAIAGLGTQAEPPSRFEVTVEGLRAWSSDGRVLWTYTFSEPLQSLNYFSHATFGRTILADMDGDGHREVVAVVHHPGKGTKAWREIVYCFSETGRVLWSYEPTFSLSFDGKKFEGPWRFYALHGSKGPGPQRVWVSYGHHTWWPSIVIELDAHGSGRTRYVQSGAVYDLAYWRRGASGYLAAVGVNNEYGRASVAVLKVDAAAATSPQKRGGGFHCDACPPGSPEFFALLPRTEINHASGKPYNLANSVVVLGDIVRIGVSESGRNPDVSAIYRLEAGRLFDEAELSDTFGESHKELEQAQALDHSAERCPLLRDAFYIETWTSGGGWTTSTFRFAWPGVADPTNTR